VRNTRATTQLDSIHLNPVFVLKGQRIQDVSVVLSISSSGSHPARNKKEEKGGKKSCNHEPATPILGQSRPRKRGTTTANHNAIHIDICHTAEFAPPIRTSCLHEGQKKKRMRHTKSLTVLAPTPMTKQRQAPQLAKRFFLTEQTAAKSTLARPPMKNVPPKSATSPH